MDLATPVTPRNYWLISVVLVVVSAAVSNLGLNLQVGAGVVGKSISFQFMRNTGSQSIFTSPHLSMCANPHLNPVTKGYGDVRMGLAFPIITSVLLTH